MSNDLWYPGRIPLCTRQVIRGLQHYIETLHTAIYQQDATQITVANRIHQDIYKVLYEEGCSCLGSDADINNLLTMLIRAQQAAELCAQQNCWDDLYDVINAIDTVRWNLITKQDNGGTDDGEEPGVVATTDAYGRAICRSDCTEDTQQAERLDDANRRSEGESKVSSCDEAAEEEALEA